MIKQLVPWPIKFMTKLALGATGIDYKLLKRAGVVEHGRMEQASFASEIFALHVTSVLRDWKLAPSGTLLELGPGDSIATGVLGRAAGFSAVELIDAAPCADLRPTELRRLFTALGAQPLPLTSSATPQQVLARLCAAGINYRTDSVRSLQVVPGGTITHSFSNTVLQHVHRDELPELLRQLCRVHAPGSSASHGVNFSDHFSGGFVNHRLPDWLMESSLVKRGNLYTNRVTPLRMLELFECSGFRPRQLSVEFCDDAAPRRCLYTSPAAFRSGVGSRTILRVIFLLQKD